MSDFHFDFAVFLTLLTVVSGIGWGWDRYRVSRDGGLAEEEAGRFIEFCRFAFPVVAIVLVLRSFLFEPFRIPSGSMIPTLHVGDFILVNKFSYGLRTPVGFWKFVDLGEPHRGDVAVFRFPLDPSKDFIKRVVGLPGDRITYVDKRLFINGEPVPLEDKGMMRLNYAGRSRLVQEYIETLGDVRHSIIVDPAVPSFDGEVVVPAGHYFVMGDNRDGSDDSRRWGMVPERNLVGRAVLIWMSWDGESHRIDFGRIGTAIH